MGLDMYLSRKTYVKNWKHQSPEERVKITIVNEATGEPIPALDASKVSYVEEEVGYWRKANAIHDWFVKNVQNGVDECQESEVEFEKLQELLDEVNKVLDSIVLVDGKIQNGSHAGPETGGKIVPNMEDGQNIKDSSVAEEVLPTNVNGCFFGSGDYDEYYVQDLKLTKEIIEKVLADRKEQEENKEGFHYGSIYYRASW